MSLRTVLLKEDKVNKQAKKILGVTVVVALFSLVLFMNFGFSAHVVGVQPGGTSYYLLEDISYEINVTVNNTDTGLGANITQVNITVPSSFTILGTLNASALFSTNGTAQTNFSTVRTTYTLSWTNATTYLLNGTDYGYFSFNVSASTPGNYNITVETLNATGINYANISVTINNTTPTFGSTSVTYGNYSGDLLLNLSTEDIYFFGGDSINFTVTNGSAVLNATYVPSNLTFDQWNFTIDTTQFPDGQYNISMNFNDSTGNLINVPVLVDVWFDNTAPSTVSLDLSNAAVNALTIAITRSDAASGISSCSSSGGNSPSISGTTLSDSGLGCGASYSYIVTCTDFAGNTKASASTSFPTDGCGGSSSVSTGVTWKNTFVEDSKELSESPVDRGLKSKQRVKLKISGETHYVGVKELTATTATIEVSSTPQEATLRVGDERRFDLDEDGIYYNLYVKLNSIADDKADLTILAISEVITPDTIAEEEESEVAATTGTGEIDTSTEEEPTSGGIWWIVVLVVVVIAVIVFFVAKGKK